MDWCDTTLVCCLDERVGNLTFVHANTAEIPAVKSQVTLVVRGMYSNPPSHGARIVAAVLRNPQLYEQWLVYTYLFIFKNDYDGELNYLQA